ncbi:type I toxin-antitoxin system Ibs family toxin [Hafnia psychrotolerans]|nr:type I toxin-antitoxin system Ibs family toxin [Hafnia psychrotolerans]
MMKLIIILIVLLVVSFAAY